MLYLNEFRKVPDRLSDLLPWGLMISKTTVLCKDNSKLSVIKLDGKDLDSFTDNERDYFFNRLNNILKRFGSGWCLYFESVLVEDLNESLRLEFYITVQFLGDGGEQKGFFDDEVAKFVDLLAGLFGEVRVLEGAQILSFLHNCVSGKRLELKEIDRAIYLDCLTDDDLVTGKVVKLGSKFLGVVGVRGFPNFFDDDFLNSLLGLDFKFRLSVRWIGLDSLDAQNEIKSIKRKWFGKRKSLATHFKEAFFGESSVMEDSGAVSKATECDGALNELQDGETSFGYFTNSIVVLADDEKELDFKLKCIETVINEAGFIAKKETYNAVDAWLGTIPGNARNNVRRPLMSSSNLARLIPVVDGWCGKKDNFLFIAKSESRNFYYPKKYQDVGHTILVGATGSGKSYFLGHLAYEFFKQKGKVFFFDKGKSSLDVTKKVGGNFSDLSKASFQPLKLINDFSFEFVLDLIENEGVKITSTIKEEVLRRLDILKTCPVEERTITNLIRLLQDFELRDTLKVYSNNGAYGKLLDGVESAEVDNNNWQVFELEGLLQTPRIVPFVLKYLFYKIESNFTGEPSMLILDEAWVYLDNEKFSSKIREWLKTLRKKNVSVIFATQSISDLTESRISSSLLENCPIRIYLPNFRSREPEIRKHYEALGLNERQIEIIASGEPKRDYYYTSPEGSRVFQI